MTPANDFAALVEAYTKAVRAWQYALGREHISRVEETERDLNHARAALLAYGKDLEKDAKRLSLLDRIALEAIEVESFGCRTMIDDIATGKRLGSGDTIREALDAVVEVHPIYAEEQKEK